MAAFVPLTLITLAVGIRPALIRVGPSGEPRVEDRLSARSAPVEIRGFPELEPKDPPPATGRSREHNDGATAAPRLATEPSPTLRGLGAKKPNILFILADDVGYGDFGFTGHPYVRTPTIDSLAAQGAFFKNFYVSAPICSPSRTAFMTGRLHATFPKKPAVYGFSGAVTVTELLRRMGYRTAHFGKWDIGPDRRAGTYGIDVIERIRGEPTGEHGRDTPITEAAIRFLREHKSRPEPFYLNVWYHTIHSPVEPPQGYLKPFEGLRVRISDFRNPHMISTLEEYQKVEDIHLGMRKYVAEMAQLDDQVARLLRALSDFGFGEETLVVLTSDNGPAGYGSAGVFRGGKHTLYDGGVHLPLLVRWPGHVQAGRVDDTSVLAAVDLLPTLASIAGVMPAGESFALDGEDVSDILLGQGRSRKRDLFWRWVIRRGSWKLHLSRGVPELYDLAKDPGERVNVAGENPSVVRELTGALNDWTASLPKQRPGSESEEDDRRQ